MVIPLFLIRTATMFCVPERGSPAVRQHVWRPVPIQLQWVSCEDVGRTSHCENRLISLLPVVVPFIANAVTHGSCTAGKRRAALHPGPAIDRRGGMSNSSDDITGLLRAATNGERQDVDALMSAIYADLRRIADNQLRNERSDHTLQPTALVHEAWIRLVDQHATDWKDRAHFFAIASRVIRRILVDHARGKGAEKRGRGYRQVSIESAELAGPEANLDLVALDQALEELAELDPRQAGIVEMKFFGGLTIEEIAEALSMGRRSVDRQWSAARAWLFVRLADDLGGA
jgi:RNA polymerase sigma-70 factor, ECF subfamily